MGKLPAIQFYPGDWHKDIGVQSLTLEERGAWFEILLIMHESERRGMLLLGDQPMPDEILATILRCDVAKLKQMLSKIVANKVAEKLPDGTLINRRMIRDEEIRRVRAESGHLGGIQKAKNSLSKTLAKSTPSSSYSSSSTSTTTSKEKYKKEKFQKPTVEQARAYAVSIGFDLDAQGFVDYYESKGWLVGRTPMKSWEAAVRTWRRNNFSKGGQNGGTRNGNAVVGGAAYIPGKYANISE